MFKEVQMVRVVVAVLVCCLCLPGYSWAVMPPGGALHILNVMEVGVAGVATFATATMVIVVGIALAFKAGILGKRAVNCVDADGRIARDEYGNAHKS